jgi:hypothetical protein
MVAPAWGLVAGVPETPRPGPLPTAWLGWTNDSYGGCIGKDMDDFRTNSFSFGLRWERFVLASDYSMFTDYRSSNASLKRSDETTTTVGYEIIPDGDMIAGGRTWLAVGAGARVSGDMGGDTVQNRWHDLLRYRRIEVDYASEKGIEAVAYGSGRWQFTNADTLSLPVIGDIAPRRAGFEVEGSVLVSSDGSVDGSIGISLVVVGFDGAASLGVHQEFHKGHRSSEPAYATAGHESGTWVTVSSSAGGWFYRIGYNLDEQSGLGTIGWMWDRPAGRDIDAGVGVVEGIVGFYQGYSYGFQYRWHAAWLNELVDDRLAFLVDYRFGQHPQQNWRHNGLVVRQPLVGVDWSLADAQDGFQIVPFIYGGVGIREEKVVVNGPRPRFPNQKNITGVAQGGVGLRVFFGDRPTRSDPARYGLSLVYDGWLPFKRATAENAFGTDEDTYQKPGHGFGVRLAAQVMW